MVPFKIPVFLKAPSKTNHTNHPNISNNGHTFKIAHLPLQQKNLYPNKWWPCKKSDSQTLTPLCF